MLVYKYNMLVLDIKTQKKIVFDQIGTTCRSYTCLHGHGMTGIWKQPLGQEDDANNNICIY